MKILCDICNSPMKYEKSLSCNKHYKIKRYLCSCGYEKTIFGSGIVDEIYVPLWAENCIKQMYKQQEENNL